MSDKLSAQEFVHKWEKSELKETASYQSHFNDLCRLIDHGTPVDLDPKGDWFTFQPGIKKLGGEQGFADVWKKGYFAWEYKGKHKDLDAAYKQLLQYREALLNPPLLIVSDMEEILIHTNFTNTAKQIYILSFDDILTKEGRELLFKVFNDPVSLKIPITLDQVTEEAATEFAQLADLLRKWGEDPQKTSHFLIRLLFCLFAEDIGLLPRNLFTDLVTQAKGKTIDFTEPLRELFTIMADGGYYGPHKILKFDGQLFDDDFVLEVPSDGLDIIRSVCNLDWSSIEPAILGTLFERSLDPSSRAELGAQYTSKEDIQLIIEPVLMHPLRKEWKIIREESLRIKQLIDNSDDNNCDLIFKLEELLLGFFKHIGTIKILDPACGSGNFLYVALKQLLDFQKEILNFALEECGIRFLPDASPEQLYGIEKNTYACELVQATVWIGYIQWMFDNGFDLPGEPILQPLTNFSNSDAILMCSDTGLIEPAWPECNVIIGNPPYLGNKRMRKELGDEYVDNLRSVYSDRLPGGCDLVCYWFEKSRAIIETGESIRVGLLATQSIRKGANRTTLDRIKETGNIFWAISDRNWILDGALVHVSMVGFDEGSSEIISLDGEKVNSINADLSSGIDLTQVQELPENKGVSFQGVIEAGPFTLSEKTAQKFINDKGNPNKKPNTDVIKPWYIAEDITDRPRNISIIDFGTNMSIDNEKYKAIASKSAELVSKREAWLNSEEELEDETNERTLTNLYNEFPTWLRHCHEKLDQAVLDAYGWTYGIGDQEILENLMELNNTRSN